MTTSPSRRRFIEITPFIGIALLAACSPKSEPVPPAATNIPPTPMPDPVPTPTPTIAAVPVDQLPMVDEKEPQAAALGYVADATTADTARFKNYAPGNQCSSCVLYQGQAGDAVGPCSIFPGKGVAAKGWCTSWIKKA